MKNLKLKAKRILDTILDTVKYTVKYISPNKIPALVTGGLLFYNAAEGVTAIEGYENPSVDSVYADSIRSWRDGLPGETRGLVNQETGYFYLPFHAGWQPWPRINDTINIEGWKWVGGQKYIGKVKVVLDEDVSKTLEFHLDKLDSLYGFTPNGIVVRDETGLPGQPIGITYKVSNPSLACTTYIDTGTQHSSDFYQNIEPLDVGEGDSMITEIRKGSIVKYFSWVVTNELWQAKKIFDEVTLRPTRVEEVKNKGLESKLYVWPTISRGIVYTNMEGKKGVYRVDGSKVSEHYGKYIILQERGIYFIIDKDGRKEKVVRP